MNDEPFTIEVEEREDPMVQKIRRLRVVDLREAGNSQYQIKGDVDTEDRKQRLKDHTTRIRYEMKQLKKGDLHEKTRLCS